MARVILTKFTKLTGVRTPVVAAAMAGASGGALAGQVARAGGYGFLAGYGTLEMLRKELDTARSLVPSTTNGVLPVGVGFLGWLLDKSESQAKDQISLALNNRVQAIWLSFGDRLEYWVKYIRQLNAEKGNPDILIFILVTSAKEAEWALNVLKADVIIAQGCEAGGHGSATGTPILSLVPEVLAVVPRNGPPVLAAGGMATGAHLAASLALGASGIVVGTRFLLAPESLYSDSQRKALIAAESSQSVRTMAFDEARETLGWPKGIDGRGLRNDTVDDYTRGEDIAVIRAKFQQALKTNDPSRIVVWAGSSVGLMNKVQPAKDIVSEIHQEALDRIDYIAKL